MSSPGLRQEYQASGKALASHDYSKEQGQSKRAGAGVAVGARELSFHCLERACGAQQIVRRYGVETRDSGEHRQEYTYLHAWYGIRQSNKQFPARRDLIAPRPNPCLTSTSSVIHAQSTDNKDTISTADHRFPTLLARPPAATQ